MIAERYSVVTGALKENLAILDSGILSFDIDGVIQATHGLAINHVSHKLGLSVVKDQMISYWELAKIAERNGVPEEDAISFMKNAFNRDEVFLGSPPVPGALSLLSMLRDLEIPHVFISSRPTKFLKVTQAWFTKTLPWVDPRNVILERSEDIPGGPYKAAKVKQLGISLHIEDAYEEAIEVAENTGACVVMPPQPWNLRDLIDHTKIKRTGPYTDNSGLWPVVRFLAGPEARDFLSVAHY